ncbi:MAG: DUF3868 domain-containing protein [Muribaculaceae bacterium]|nr:DUF3868 domain-containing protein [Muribaculaceae bacterium]
MNFNLRHIIAAAALALPSFTFAAADIATDAVSVAASDVTHSEENFFVKMAIDLSGYKGLNSNRDITITPILAGETDTVRFQPIMVAGRARYYLHLRQGENSRAVKTLYQAGKVGTVDYSATTKYEPWMDLSKLSLEAQSCGCCGEPIALVDIPVLEIDLVPKEAPQFTPHFAFVQPKAELEKRREIRGQAYIDFPVNRTELYPDYRRNPQELKKILATIDSVRLDKDVTLKNMTIHGYASPEGSYANNVRLARGRTATLKDYVLAQYSFQQSLVDTAYTPEDWAGLRRYVENSTIANRQGILDIIDSDLQPDPKNEAIRKRYPQQYAFLLKEVYPGLRHSDYTIEYNVRNFTDINEIKELMRTNPGKLSLNEMFAAASSMTPGTEEYNHAFEVAVLLHPDNEEANLNAANIAMQAGNFSKAETYLKKAGNSPQATYARGLLEALKGDYKLAKAALEIAETGGVSEAAEAIDQIRAIEEFHEKYPDAKNK